MRAKARRRGTYAFGHGRLGLTLRAVTGRMIAGLIAERPPAFDASP